MKTFEGYISKIIRNFVDYHPIEVGAKVTNVDRGEVIEFDLTDGARLTINKRDENFDPNKKYRVVIEEVE